MKKRLNVLTRIGNLQSQMHDLGRWRLSAIERQQAGLSEDLRAIFETLESGEIAYGAQSNLGARHIRTLQRRLDTLARESENVRSKTEAHGMRAKLAEQAIETIGARYRDLKERKELAELVERAIARRSVSST
jgi:hypothetical protein